jgi:hypothetical protein
VCERERERERERESREREGEANDARQWWWVKQPAIDHDVWTVNYIATRSPAE